MACRDLYAELCSFRNLEFAFRNARRNKRCKRDVQDFEFNLERNLLQLKRELETLTYEPRPLKQFVIRDPKTRLISASHFRDRVVHHALCNVIYPMIERTFIHDSCANRVNKGTFMALERLDTFKRKVTQNGRPINKANNGNMVIGYALKADVRHFFDSIDHEVLIRIIERKIKDGNILLLIRKILGNHVMKHPGKGMPVGNLTSQFFANVYLNELDYFVKHELGTKYYIRYVDDFILLDRSRDLLGKHKVRINGFLKSNLMLELHPEKTQVWPLSKGLRFLGFRMFYHYKLLGKANIRMIEERLAAFKHKCRNGELRYCDIKGSMESWMGYARQANTYKMRQKILRKCEQLNPEKSNASYTFQIPKHT